MFWQWLLAWLFCFFFLVFSNKNRTKDYCIEWRRHVTHVMTQSIYFFHTHASHLYSRLIKRRKEKNPTIVHFTVLNIIVIIALNFMHARRDMKRKFLYMSTKNNLRLFDLSICCYKWNKNRHCLYYVLLKCFSRWDKGNETTTTKKWSLIFKCIFSMTQ